MKISRQDAAGFPYFLNHKSARMWMKEKYGCFFVMASNDIRRNEKVYHYHLVADKEIYLRKRRDDRDGVESTISSQEFRQAYQYIEITDRGKMMIDFEEERTEMTN